MILWVNSFFIASVHCDWNDCFLEESFLLGKTIACFAEETTTYHCAIQGFAEIRSLLDAEIPFLEELQGMLIQDKRNFFRRDIGVVIKKRPGDNINEVFFWEISIILSLADHVTPSFPLEYFNKKIVVQPYENLSHGPWLLDLPHPSVIEKVSLEEYWKAHILAYILGAGDLSSLNIGILPDGRIRFFDNEAAFLDNRRPHRDHCSFFLPFVSVAFDWIQYRQKLNRELARNLQMFVASLRDKSPTLHLYSKIRDIPERWILNILERIEILNQFDFSEGKAFLDVIYFLYPEIAKGMDELNTIISEILQKKVDHGAALFFVTQMLKCFKISNKDKSLIDIWVNCYLPSSSD